MSRTSDHVGLLVDRLTSLEQSFQRLDSNDDRAAVVRDAWRTLIGQDAELQDLVRWKDEALTVLSAWEKVWQAAGRPGPLGRSMAENTAAEIARLKSDLEASETALTAALHHLDLCRRSALEREQQVGP
jgi:hypothetical protein